MADLDTFLIILYVLCDDFSKHWLASQQRRPGPSAALWPAEVLVLALLQQWSIFASQRRFYAFAQRHLRSAFPTLPDRSQYNRAVRKQRPLLVAFNTYMQTLLQANACAFEVLDTLPVPVRNARRRGAGWLAGMANIGWSTRLGWFEGFRLLLSSNPEGVITGFAFGSGSGKEQPLTESFLALRRFPQPRLPTVGLPARGPYLADNGFSGRPNYAHWRHSYGAEVLAAPKHQEFGAWTRQYRRWFSGLRQIVETVYDKLVNMFLLGQRRPHSLDGFQAGLEATVALHNALIWLNKQLGRPSLAFADLLAW